MEGLQGEQGAENGVVRGEFRVLLRWIKPGCRKFLHFPQ
jgi:hypothetical protein